jgi:hypothetical protein
MSRTLSMRKARPERSAASAGVWRTLAALGPLDLSAHGAEVLAFKPLSWTQ